MRLINRFLIPCLLILITGAVFGKEGVLYSFSHIKFREAQYPEEIGIILLVPKALWFHPGMVVVSDGSVEGMGADVEILEEKDGMIKVRVGIDIADCEHAMEDDHNWRLASVSGPKVTLKKDQIFIPVIYFKHCMIGVSVGQKVINDPVVQGWLKEHELKE